MNQASNSALFLQSNTVTVQALCQRIEKLSGENPTGTRPLHEIEREWTMCVARKDMLDYLEEEAACKNLSSLEAALLDDIVFDALWQLYAERQTDPYSTPADLETVVNTKPDAFMRLAAAGVTSDASLQDAVTDFAALVMKASSALPVCEKESEAPISILDKFEAVEITNVSRISGEELAFCTAQQALYAAVLNQHRYVFEVLCKLDTDCHSFLESVSEDNKYSEGPYSSTRYHCEYVKLSKKEFAHDNIGGIHRTFVSTIMGYFTKKYGVDIETPEYLPLLGLEEPKEPDRPWAYSRRKDWTDEELDRMDAEDRAYKQATEAYLDAIIGAQLDYNTLLDYIFVELDGSTFAERAEQEIKEGSRDASHYSGKVKYALKNKRLAFKILHASKSFSDYYDVSLNNDNYKAILRALTYFDSGKQETDIYAGWHSFIGYSKSERDGIFETHSVFGHKIEAFRYYKNGKFEVTFTSHAAAQQFISEYLYPDEGGEDD